MSATDSTGENNSASLSLFKKSKRRAANIRKRPLDKQGEDNQDNVSPALETAEETQPAGASAAAETVESNASADIEARPAKKQKLTGIVSSSSRKNTSTTMTANSETGAEKQHDDVPADGEARSVDTADGTQVEYYYKRAMDATRTVEPEMPNPSSSASSSAKADNKAAAPTEESPQAEDDTGLYKGKKGYTNRASGTGTRRAGPFKAATNVRSTSVVDYQPNVCKDYKETGYCGYGDSCIFMHDRGTYKTGWQLEKEFEEAQLGVQRDNPNLWTVEEDPNEIKNTHKDAEELPFACLICRKPFVTPVVTKCQHYFCEACALKHYRKTPKCFACGAATGGVFKPAKNILAAASKKRMVDIDHREGSRLFD
ncbi:RNA-splicing factor [Coemansia sp. Benny D115]|nr:RNA-splicing factor [Coemansia sp. Benny D115]